MDLNPPASKAVATTIAVAIILFGYLGYRPGTVVNAGVANERPETAQQSPSPIIPPVMISPPGAAKIEQTSQGTRPAAELIASFDGLGVGFAGPHGTANFRNPSDNSLAVGPNHIFQIVNSRMAIYSKKGQQFDTTGKVLYGPVPTNTIFKGFGGACEATNNGDAVVRYDQLADRWLVVPTFRRGAVRPDQPQPGHSGEPAQDHGHLCRRCSGNSVNTSAGGGGVRWYEFRINKKGSVSLYQQGTYAPEGFYRWMASPAMDRLGDIGIGYSFGGRPNFAGQRFAGRLAKDPLGQLTLHETVMVEGEGAQTNTLRWEDYSQTAVDPSNDCTIWYVGDYFKKDATSYSSRIGAFRMPGCR